MLAIAMQIKDSISHSTRPKVHRLPASVVRPKPVLSIVTPQEEPKKAKIGWLLAALPMALALAAGGWTLTRHKGLSGSITVGTPITTAVLPDAAGDASGQKDTIILQGDADAIVGQLVKIPAENEHITEIKSVSEIDNNAGRELLSIISKY